MPRKTSDSNPAGKPKKPSAPRRTGKKSAPQQADLFENQPLAEPPKKVKAPASSKTAKPHPSAPQPTAIPQKKAVNTSIKTNAAQYTHKIPYIAILVVGYVALVLSLDVFVTIGDYRTVNWGVFLWRPADLQALLELLHVPHFLVSWMGLSLLTQVDLFKLFFWLAIPAAICFWHMDWDYFTTRRIKPLDWQFLIGMCVLAVLAIVSVRFIPALSHIYHGSGEISLLGKLSFLIKKLLWVLSWLVGWEFMHRYFLLRRVALDFPRFGWLLVPLSEGTYHLVKPWPEMLAMVAFSVLMTQYTLRRKNVVVPFLAHLAVELSLIVGMMVW